VSVWDVERTFGATGGSPNGASGAGGKRKKTELEVGEIWRAKNVSPPCCICWTQALILGLDAQHVFGYQTAKSSPVSSSLTVQLLALGQRHEERHCEAVRHPPA
jgi:hypothetical protein